MIIVRLYCIEPKRTENMDERKIDILKKKNTTDKVIF